MIEHSTNKNGSAEDSDLTFRPLGTEDAATISALLLDQPPGYARFFYAFDFSEGQIAEMLARKIRDVYSGIFWKGKLIGIFMLRGWDAGFDIPSFGVLVSEKYRGGVFMKISLEHAKLICRLSGASALMAKIHPDNISSRGAQRLGFVQMGTEADTGNIIYHMAL